MYCVGTVFIFLSLDLTFPWWEHMYSSILVMHCPFRMKFYNKVYAFGEKNMGWISVYVAHFLRGAYTTCIYREDEGSVLFISCTRYCTKSGNKNEGIW